MSNLTPLALADFGGRFLTTSRNLHAGETYPGPTAYVEWFVPVEPKSVSITFVHGGGGQSSEFLRTPDGRPGWAHAFLRAGYPVYLLDRPGHGRSRWDRRVLGSAMEPPSYEQLGPRFFEAAKSQLWPGAEKHTQWPGGETPVDRFMASQGPMATSLAASQEHVEAIAQGLFSMVGDTVLLSHSAGAPCGWALAAIGGPSVKAIVAVEPLGCPGFKHPLGQFSHGLNAAPLSGEHDPFMRPIAVVTGEASWMREANAQAADYIRGRGNHVDHIRLEEKGIFGNGHMLMSEYNSDDIAREIIDWLAGHVS